MAGGWGRALRPGVSRLVVDALGLHLAEEIRVDERAEVEGLGELALLLQLRLGEPEKTDGEVVQDHLEAELRHELLDQRRVEALEKVGDVLGGALAILVDEVGRLDERG